VFMTHSSANTMMVSRYGCRCAEKRRCKRDELAAELDILQEPSDRNETVTPANAGIAAGGTIARGETPAAAGMTGSSRIGQNPAGGVRGVIEGVLGAVFAAQLRDDLAGIEHQDAVGDGQQLDVVG